MGKNKYYKGYYIDCYLAEGLVPMWLVTPLEDKIQNDLDSNNMIVPKSIFHKILQLYENVAQHGYENVFSSEISNVKFPVLSSKRLKYVTLKYISAFKIN